MKFKDRSDLLARIAFSRSPAFEPPVCGERDPNAGVFSVAFSRPFCKHDATYLRVKLQVVGVFAVTSSRPLFKYDARSVRSQVRCVTPP